jgi:immune inhibitor A
MTRYADGPTLCAPHPRVRRSIEKEIRAARAVSRTDVRLAAAMGMVATDSVRHPGLNDGIIYPPTEVPSPARAANVSPSRRLSPAPLKKRKLHALALLVDFSDNPGRRDPADFQRLIFDSTNPGSMTSYYLELSGGALEVTGNVIPYVRAPRPYSFYTAGRSGMGDSFPNNTPGLLVDALTEFCRNDNLTRFDVDGDGYVDGIFLIHAGGGAEAEPVKARRPDKIWSHKWVLPNPFVNQGVKVFAYSTEPEDGHLGVFAHEFGHVLGLPDLYDTNYKSEGIGDWCLMAGGEWGDDGDRPCRMSAWCLSRLGWITPTNVKKARSLTVPPLARKKTSCYRLWDKGKSGPEYFLLENRQQTGMDAALPGSGLLVWHVDERQSDNDNPLSYLVALVQADGSQDLEFNRNSGDSGDAFPGKAKVTALSSQTSPSTDANDGSSTGVALSQIKVAGDEVSLKVKV